VRTLRWSQWGLGQVGGFVVYPMMVSGLGQVGWGCVGQVGGLLGPGEWLGQVNGCLGQVSWVVWARVGCACPQLGQASVVASVVGVFVPAL
jgi:hypothetical protein